MRPRLKDLPGDVLNNMNDDEYYRRQAEDEAAEELERSIERTIEDEE